VYGWSFKSHLKVLRYFHKKIPVFFRGDSTLIEESNQLKKLLRSAFLKWIYSKVDKALYVGTHNRNYYLKFGMKMEQLILVPHAIDNERFSPNSTNKNSSQILKKSIGLKSEELVFLFAGKLEHKKNVDLLIESFKKINKEKINLVIVGNGKLERELKESSSKFKNIFFLNFQNQTLMPVIYQMADVFVLPSKGHDETWGLSINEAMASGKAVLVSDACGAAIDLVQNAVNGYTFQSENSDDLREKILRLIDNKNDLNKMGKFSLSIIRNWNYEKDCIAIEKLLNRTENLS
jgi:glycosyltransferase involved in cell wall biosynthesis